MSNPIQPGPHERWEDLMIEVLDRRAAPVASADLERHMETCQVCRGTWEEYLELFSGLDEVRAEELPAAFWESLARDVDNRVAAEAGGSGAPHAQEALTRAGAVAVAANAAAPAGPAAVPNPALAGEAPQVVDFPERPRPRAGWRSVAGGLVAAGVAVLLLAGLYLTLPRSGVRPQAFTTRQEPALALPDEGTDDTLSWLTGEADTAGEAGPDVVSGARDPLADLADAERVLQGLTPAEAEDLLRALEAQT